MVGEEIIVGLIVECGEGAANEKGSCKSCSRPEYSSNNAFLFLGKCGGRGRLCRQTLRCESTFRPDLLKICNKENTYSSARPNKSMTRRGCDSPGDEGTIHYPPQLLKPVDVVANGEQNYLFRLHPRRIVHVTQGPRSFATELPLAAS
jgi:hypothetical protein